MTVIQLNYDLYQGFLTHEALVNIAHTTLFNGYQFEKGLPLTNEVI